MSELRLSLVLDKLSRMFRNSDGVGGGYTVFRNEMHSF